MAATVNALGAAASLRPAGRRADGRRDPGDVCCKWRFSMRTPDDPEYVPVTLARKLPRG